MFIYACNFYKKTQKSSRTQKKYKIFYKIFW